MFNATAVLSHNLAAECNAAPHRLIPYISDEALAVVMPVIAYWVYSIVFHCIMAAEIPFFEQYRIHTLEDMEAKNKVSFYEVLKMVFLQQVLQTILGIMVLPAEEPTALDHGFAQQLYASYTHKWVQMVFASNSQFITNEMIQWAVFTAYWLIVPACQFVVAMYVL